MKMKMSLVSIACLLAAPLAFGDAAEVYAKHCASCHAKDGTGATVMGKKMKVMDYTTAEGQKWSDAEGLKAILEGKGKMKSYKDKITAEEAAAQVKFIRAFKK